MSKAATQEQIEALHGEIAKALMVQLRENPTGSIITSAINFVKLHTVEVEDEEPEEEPAAPKAPKRKPKKQSMAGLADELEAALGAR